jgi:ribosomal protein L11 methyltransferase
MTDTNVPRYPLVVVETTADDVDVMIGRLTLLGADGIEERDATTLAKGGASGVTLVASFATFEEARTAANEIGASARVEELVGDEWRDAWRQHWQPTRLGSRIVVVPTWIDFDPAPTDLVLRLDPGRAFGTGQHASTALAAAAVEKHVVAGMHDPMIDLGCGSGILSFVALALGLERAILCDVDPEAVASTRENAALLGWLDRIDVRVGGVDVITERSQLVVANIEAAVLVPIASSVAARVASGGRLVLSGILEDQGAAVRTAYEAAGLEYVGASVKDGWICPEFVRP